jgi:hypothetical protein
MEQKQQKQQTPITETTAQKPVGERAAAPRRLRIDPLEARVAPIAIGGEKSPKKSWQGCRIRDVYLSERQTRRRP